MKQRASLKNKLIISVQGEEKLSTTHVKRRLGLLLTGSAVSMSFLLDE